MCSSSASRELNKSCTVIGYKSKQYGQPWSLRIICCVVDKNCALYTMYYVHQACLAKMAGCEHWSLLNAILIMTHTCYHFQKTWQKEWTWPIFSHVELMLTSQELPCVCQNKSSCKSIHMKMRASYRFIFNEMFCTKTEKQSQSNLEVACSMHRTDRQVDGKILLPDKKTLFVIHVVITFENNSPRYPFLA